MLFLYGLLFIKRPISMYILQILVVSTLIAICITIFMFIRKTSVVICKYCKNEVGNQDINCPKCGQEMGNNTKEVVIKSNRNKRFIYAFVVSIVLLTSCGILFSYVYSEGYLGGLSTGLYSGKKELYLQSNNIWGVEIDDALTAGTLNKIIDVEDEKPSQLLIESTCTSGTLILNVVQDDKVKSIDISNTNEQIKFDLSEYSDNDIKLSIKHTGAKNIKFKIEW